MLKKLAFRAAFAFILGVILVAVLVFIPTGTLRFPGGIRLMCVLFVPILIAGIVMLIKSPELLQKRLESKEKRGAQTVIVKLSGLMFIAGFVVAGLDFRFKWLPVPEWISWTAAAIFIAGYAMYAEVLRENAYLSRTIGVSEGQKVIDTGLYGIIRHPMYTSTLLLFLTIPLILGSVIALACFLIYPVLIVCRLLDEEALLEKELDGYSEYKKKVTRRLIPFIW